MKQSCDTYFYEIARRLGVDKLSETAKKFGLGEKVFGNLFNIEKRINSKYRVEKKCIRSGMVTREQLSQELVKAIFKQLQYSFV